MGSIPQVPFIDRNAVAQADAPEFILKRFLPIMVGSMRDIVALGIMAKSRTLVFFVYLHQKFHWLGNSPPQIAHSYHPFLTMFVAPHFGQRRKIISMLKPSE
jgi:hypothetical protein